MINCEKAKKSRRKAGDVNRNNSRKCGKYAPIGCHTQRCWGNRTAYREKTSVREMNGITVSEDRPPEAWESSGI